MSTESIDDARRRLLVQALAAGIFAVGGARVSAGVLGRVPGRLPPDRSIYALEGEVTVSGKRATIASKITAGDLIETGAKSRIIFVVGQDAFILRGNSRLQLSPARGGVLVGALRVVTGQLLSVFGKSAHRVETATATIGIRGTGLYVESDPEESYVCTCYGIADIAASADPASRETVTSRHHDAARYVSVSGGSGTRISPAPFKDHTDEELSLIEALVGRSPPFETFGGLYGAPRRQDY